MKLPSTLRRADWLAEIQHLLLIVFVLVIAAGFVGAATTVRGTVELPLPARAALGVDALSNSGLPLSPSADVTIRLEHPTHGQVTLGLLTHAPAWLLTCLTLGLLWWLVRRARRAELFSEGLARRLRQLGLLLALGGPVATLVEFVASFALAGTLPAVTPQATLDLAPIGAWLLLGFGILAISEVVRRGQVLRAELDGVV